MLATSAMSTKRAARTAEQQVVKNELRNFELTHLPATLIPARSRTASHGALSDSTDTAAPLAPPTAAAAPPPGMTAAAAATRTNRTEQTQKLLQMPFAGAAVHGERTMLDEAQQVHNAVAWLRGCPTSTLRQLQQRVLCATETLFMQLVGMPATAQELLALSADPNSKRRDDVSDQEAQSVEAAELAANAYVTPPPSLTFTEFLSTFVVDTVAAASSSLNGVLATGRPQPAAPLSSLHLVYGLHVVEDALRSPAAPTAATAGLEGHPALMSDVVHWARFFEDIFDKAHEGLCRDPLNFYVGVLLACAERGAWELANTPDAIAEEAVRRLQLDDSSTGRRPHVCAACQKEATHLANCCRTYVHNTLRTMHYSGAVSSEPKLPTSTAKKGSRRPRPDQPASTRFFLATPAVVWWAAAFLRLYRLRTPVAAAVLTGDAQPPRASTDDEVSTAEAYFVRDWIARAATMDAAGFAAQEKIGGISIPLSCATRAPVAVVGFTKENVRAAVSRMAAWVDAGVATNAPLLVQDLLACLQDDFPVVPYYLSFFSGQ